LSVIGLDLDDSRMRKHILTRYKQTTIECNIVGKSEKLMDLVMQMCMGVTAATIEKTSHGNLERNESFG
jgi:hypothetical protein